MTSSKIVLITGCSSGIGYSTAYYLRERGHRVICSARKPEDVERLRSEGYECLQLDLADSASIQVAVAALIELTGGRIDALFNNGAFGQPGAVEDLSREVLRHQFETNLFGTHELTNLILPLMRKQGHGRIIYNSSVLGFVAMKFRGAYNASKYALEGLADTLRLELRGSGIHIVLIEPGPIKSNFRQNAFALYQKYIDPEHSAHRDTYLAMEARLQKQGPASPFTLPATAVAEKVRHALESEKPRSRYPVTLPTYVFAWLKRLLPTAWLDRLLVSVE
ncbi:SDR family oxidoreductase [Methylomonas sp. MED-D]|uniref:Short-chain dehydrogenase/reductase n=1 Tax=Methylomonas koyamae TaxID=702114 RepID=A0A177N2T7_9GAMM|nr:MULTISPECIES: SDR family oxidoreductase [Methylomonas]MDT4332777.1 SDR family oxidoreductase [Methylomonas sp. MV1]NJA04745.1 SDR family oxidoreductase [Methylococcaceae bacterium WWC4]OAI12192.1 short-chain dehydrogenase/reductase [Methylomonas koyamae]OHX34284.1 short-chain dehydrogenase [Methylomonas sp. LWB]